MSRTTFVSPATKKTNQLESTGCARKLHNITLLSLVATEKCTISFLYSHFVCIDIKVMVRVGVSVSFSVYM